MDINKDAFRKWIATLRSGRFKQLKGKLTSIDQESNIVGCCCLGVACEVALEEGIHLDIDNDSEASTRRYDGMGANLPHKVIDWLGVAEVDDVILLDEYKFPERQGGEVHKLYASTANDHMDISWDFNQIADALEKKYLPEDVKE